MPGPNSIAQRLDRALAFGLARLRGGTETERARRFYGAFRRYHTTNDDSEHAWIRSRWVATTAVPRVHARSVLEIGCNTGRTLALLQQHDAGLRLKGIDVNPHAIAAARRLHPGIEFEVGDATEWAPAPDSWDVVLCMSALNWMPDEGAERVATAVERAARAVIAVELWDGGNGERGLYTYSRDTRALFESRGWSTLQWELAPGQYDEVRRPLWAYIGVRDGAPRAGSAADEVVDGDRGRAGGLDQVRPDQPGVG